MNNKELRELVKKHFNLTEVVEETVEVKEEMSEEVASEQTFGEISTADGELTLTYEGEELSIGLPIFVKTEDGNVPAPDGSHALEGGVVIETEGGSIVEISAEEEEVAEEVVEEEVVASEHEMSEELSEEEMAEETEESETIAEGMEETEEEVEMEEKADIIEAIAEILVPQIEEMKKEIEEMKAKFNSTEEKVEKFALAPAAERTKAEIKNRNTSKRNVGFNPINDSKQKQFERLLKIRNKK